jgi:hypothetical protein
MYRIEVVMMKDGKAEEAILDYEHRPIIDTMDGVLTISGQDGETIKAVAPGFWSVFNAFPVKDPE